MAHDEEHSYHAKDALGPAVKAGMTTGVVGVIFSGIQSALTKQNIGPLGAFTRYGGTAAIFTATGMSYVFTRNVTANLREKDDAYGSALGGFVAGSIVGVKGRTVASILGMGAFTAVLTGAMTYTGGSLKGGEKDQDADRVAQKDAVRKNYRSPIEQTISELGEGRGIHGPGYAERRKQRIKDNYGIEVP